MKNLVKRFEKAVAEYYNCGGEHPDDIPAKNKEYEDAKAVLLAHTAPTVSYMQGWEDAINVMDSTLSAMNKR